MERNKKIELKDGRLLEYYFNDEFVPTTSITEKYLNDIPLERELSFKKDKDYSFTAFDCYEGHKGNEDILFEYDIKHPFYIPLLHLLNGDKELIINDDHTNLDNAKYMKISNKDGVINILIHNDYAKQQSATARFRIFIKNIRYYGRSKLDRDNTDVKDRLSIFFNELESVILEEYHQITIEEYMLEKENIENKIKNVLEYYLSMMTLDEIPRTGWLDWNVKRDRIESVGEHSFDVVQFAIAMWSEFDIPVNIERVIAMLSIHETEEPVIGDIPLVHDLKKYKKEMGKIAVNEVTSSLAKKSYLRDLISEFEECETNEAKFAHYCDKMVCDIKSKYYDEDSIIDLDDQENNPSRHHSLVEKLLGEDKSFSEMWMEFGRNIYDYPFEFNEISIYASHNNLHEMRDNKLDKAKVKVNEFLNNKK